ncbi:hypothetical protein [Streptomyces fulvorobeus]|uniref:DNA-3-methyladenine glycosylase II n=1 Tax=Streptomyces fulvorobeus TaxID=284028 RepID=A0A7Y9KUP2_9ACTN|nr:hypothetical protein [Streptomyces fulvorobeus]NYE42326.1 DNA-3-methyladenine glycosylase II [Streptomyces fulvorobeus]
MSTTVITEHPAWYETPDGEPVRVVEHQGAAWLAHWERDREHLLFHPLDPDVGEQPSVAYTSSIDLPTPSEATPLLDELVCLGTVARLTNPSLWDAVTTALLRQVVTAAQARKRHRAFYTAYGRSFVTPAGRLALAPSPETVLDISDDGFAAVGAKFNRTALRAAAEAYLDRGEHWTTLDAECLIKELVEVPRIGPWTAAAAVADYTGDFSIYPHGDLAVRTWADKAAPGLALPRAEAPFEALWHRWAPDRTHLHALTLFTLTWGSNDLNGHGGTRNH